MLAILLAMAGVFALLLSSEYLWRKKILQKEYGRKYVHILVGIFVAFWPYFLPLRTIAYLAVAFLVVLAISKKFHVFHAIHDVKRKTIGEILYPVGVLSAAVLAQSTISFTVAVLFVAVADGMAAVIGKTYAKKQHVYKTYGGKKSIVGSATYLVCAVLCVAIGYALGAQEAFGNYAFISFFWLPLFCTFLEAVSPYGSDNVTVPIVVVLSCNVLLQLAA